MSVRTTLESLSSPFRNDAENVIIILAAGHGKRIKSERSKMLHEIWGVPTATRVYNASIKGVPKANAAIVVGVKAEAVADAIGKRANTQYALQEQQNGTGHAVLVALQAMPKNNMRHCYVLPGDMGLLSAEHMRWFHKRFTKSGHDMMVLTGTYSGDPNTNYYGRIVRTKEYTASGDNSSYPKLVIEIKEYKDILALKGNYTVQYRGEEYVYTKEELLSIQEFNSGVYVFKMPQLKKYITAIGSDNAQGEMYVTDLIAIFNENGCSVGAVPAQDVSTVLGFNNKSVLKYMNSLARERVYEKLKDIVTFDDPDDFFIADEVVEQIIAMDKKGVPLDVHFGRGIHIEAGARLNYGLHLHKNVTIAGAVVFGKNVNISRGTSISCFPKQKLVIGDNVEILAGNELKGRITIGDNTRIESGVKITGSDEHTVRIGAQVLIKGETYIYGGAIEDGVHVEHSVLMEKNVHAIRRADGAIQKIRFVLPQPEGLDSLSDR